MEHLASFIGDCDRRTEGAKLRLAETQEELTAEVAIIANSVHEVAEEIGKKLAKAEALGEEGFVEESMKLMEEVSCNNCQRLQGTVKFNHLIIFDQYIEVHFIILILLSVNPLVNLLLLVFKKVKLLNFFNITD